MTRLTGEGIFLCGFSRPRVIRGSEGSWFVLLIVYIGGRLRNGQFEIDLDLPYEPPTPNHFSPNLHW